MLGVLNHEQIEHVLHDNVIGRIGCHADGRTYIVPVTYFYYAGSIYGLTAAGMKMDMIRNNANVCFEVEQIQDYANWQSVIAWGVFHELKDQEAVEALNILTEGLSPHYLSQTSLQDISGLKIEDEFPNKRINDIVYRIDLVEKTGRFEKRA